VLGCLLIGQDQRAVEGYHPSLGQTLGCVAAVGCSGMFAVVSLVLVVAALRTVRRAAEGTSLASPATATSSQRSRSRRR
jgi:hypothetical protein